MITDAGLYLTWFFGLSTASFFRLSLANNTWSHELHLAGSSGLLNSKCVLQLLGHSSQGHHPQFFQQLLQQRPVEEDPTSSRSTRTSASLGPYPQHLVVSLAAVAVIHLGLFDFRIPHSEQTHQLFHLRHRNQIQNRVDEFRDCGGGERVEGESGCD